MHEINSQISLSFKQGDTGRVLHITLTENGDLFNIPQDCVAVFTALKPDGKIIFNDCEISGNEITYSITAQTTAVVGKADCELRLYGAGNTLITSPHFTIFVHPTAYYDQIESKDEVNTLTNLISEASTKLANGDFVPKLSVGTVTTLLAGSAATVEITGTPEEPVLNFGIPQGDQGQAEHLIPDAELSLDSTKPVQNKVIAEALNNQNVTFEEHSDDKENPHGVTKEQVGLGKVDNTADKDKPVSTAQAAALENTVTAAKDEMKTATDEAKAAAEEAKAAAEEVKENIAELEAKVDADGTVTTAKFAADAVAPSASKATQLATSRNITVKDSSGEHSAEAVAFDGSKDITLKMPESVKLTTLIAGSGLAGTEYPASPVEGQLFFLIEEET